MHFIDGMAKRGIPLRVFHFDCFWMRAFEWCSFEWDRDGFPDPVGMLRRIKDKGHKICVWLNPYIAQKSQLFDECVEKGYLLKRPNGDVWQWDLWQPGMGIVDFTNPDARKWYSDHLARLIDMGVDAFKSDFGERIPVDVVYHDGSDPVKMHNYYSYLYNQVVFETLRDKLGEQEAVVFARSATVGGQKFPVHWGGDCSASYASMAESLRGGLSLGICGFGFWSHDISGFEDSATPDLYKRWVAFGMLSSHSRLHGNSSYRVPWLFDDEAVDVLRHFANLKNRLMPYLFAKAVEAKDTGVPMMRAMLLEFPDDPACEHLDRQYMLGDALLVAPIFREDGKVTYYLPAGTWTHLLNGERVRGGTWRTEKYDYMSLPLFVRPNTLLAAAESAAQADYDYTDGVELHLFALDDGAAANANVFTKEGELGLAARATRNERTITVQVRGDKATHWTVRLHGIDGVRTVLGGRVEQTEEGVKLIPDEGRTELVVEL
jgi:alpha-D-xyloside xylohydrolase